MEISRELLIILISFVVLLWLLVKLAGSFPAFSCR